MRFYPVIEECRADALAGLFVATSPPRAAALHRIHFL
jgi:hypothetical protein